MLSLVERRSPLGRELGTLVLSQVERPGPMALMRVAAWHNALGRLGLHLPLFVVHDFGLLLTSPQGSAARAIRPHNALLDAVTLPGDGRRLLEQYRALLDAVADSELVAKSVSWRLRDELVAVLLGRILGDVVHRFADPAQAVGLRMLPLDPAVYQDVDLALHFRDFDRASLWGFLRHLVGNQLQIYTAVEQIDLETVRLLGVFAGTGATAPLELVDLYRTFQQVDTSDIVHFSLDLLPSVLEAKRATGVQSFSVDGYASIERRGRIDSLILTEFALDDDLIERKIVDDELYYYAHEKQRESERRVEYLLVDSSSSMRGMRQVFARGLALALAKKFALQGSEVWLRFFDARLHELQHMTRNDAAVPYVLSFRSEHGRNYGKVCRQLLAELSRLHHDAKRSVVVYLVTHGQCHLPVELVTELRRHAFLYGIFLLPSSEIALDYLDLLDRYQIVDEQTLVSRQNRRRRALDIIEDAAQAGPHPDSSETGTTGGLSTGRIPAAEGERNRSRGLR